MEDEEDDLEMTKVETAKMAEKQDGANGDMSLASGGGEAMAPSLMMASKTTAPPCHQTMKNSNMEESLDEEDEEETKMAIASDASNSDMWYYQMKLSTNRLIVTRKLLKVVKIMFHKDP
jgi:hypothetical protein